MTARTPIALAVAGSDSGGGAGIQADLKTFAALGVHAATAVTALTVQNTLGVRATHLTPPQVVAAQIDAVMEDFVVAAIKIGMLGEAAVVEAVAGRLLRRSSRKSDEEARSFVVYDPVMAASSGDLLSGAGFIEAVRTRLLPLVDCLTPNLAEAGALLAESAAENEAAMARQGRALMAFGPRAVLVKGGHLAGEEAVDLLVTADSVRRFAASKIATTNLHGTGCTLSSAIAAYVVLGLSLPEAIAAAKAFVREAIEAGRFVRFGGGPGPLIQVKVRT